MSEHFGNDALRQETNAGKADIAEQILTIGDIPKQDLQEFQHAFFQNNRVDEVRFTTKKYVVKFE